MTLRRILLLALLSGVVSCILFAMVLSLARTARSEVRPVVSCRAVDGDTLRCGEERVRLFGLDCPEPRHAGGAKAKDAMRRLVEGAAAPRIERLGRDRYGRTVAKVFIGGADVSCVMIALGVCTESARYSKGAYARCAP